MDCFMILKILQNSGNKNVWQCVKRRFVNNCKTKKYKRELLLLPNTKSKVTFNKFLKARLNSLYLAYYLRCVF